MGKCPRMTIEEEDNRTSSTRGGSTRRVLSNDIYDQAMETGLEGSPQVP